LLILSLATPQLTGNTAWRKCRGAGGVYKMGDVPALTILKDCVDFSMESFEDLDLCLICKMKEGASLKM
jgi:hypothetical protein